MTKNIRSRAGASKNVKCRKKAEHYLHPHNDQVISECVTHYVQQLAVQLANPGTGFPGLSDAVTQISSVVLQIKLQLLVPNPSCSCAVL